MKGKRIWLIVVVAALLSLATGAWASEFSADMKLQVSGHDLDAKLFVKGQKQRVEMQTPQGPVVNLLDMPAHKVYMIMTGQKMYMEMPLKANKQFTSLEMTPDNLPPGAKKVGTGQVAGYDCDIYQVDDPQSGRSKVWISQKLHYPLKAQGKGDHGSHSMELSNIKEGGVSDGQFKVPAGYTPLKMPMGMGQGMGGPAGMGKMPGRQ